MTDKGQQSFSEMKPSLLGVAKALGLFDISQLLYRKKIRILAYHRFGEQYVTARLFESQIRYLTKNFNMIDLDSFLDFLRGQKELPTNCVILTIDDGYQDFYSVAFPVLRKYAVPAIVFLTVDFIKNQMWLWHDLLNYGIKHTIRYDFTLNEKHFNLNNIKERIKLKLYLDKLCTSCSPNERDDLIGYVLRELKVSVPDFPTPEYAPLNWDQIHAMSSFDISFGAHTCTHPILSRIPLHEAYLEIRESKKRLENVLQNDILAFCYPNGTTDDFNEDIRSIVKKCGFSCAMSMIYGLNSLGSDMYSLKRMPVAGDYFIYFTQDISGFGTLRHTLRKWKRKLS